ncbi:MAG: 16S rRNA (cytosine(967)-C(5))-methyltransferase RsmB [Syntrophomonadaceae bacterium]
MKSSKRGQRVSDPRLAALQIIYQISEKGAYANLILERELERAADMPAQDRRLVTELVNGTIRMLKHLDWVLDLFLQRPVAAQNPWLRNVLRLSLYQLLFLEGIPDYAAIDSGVDLTRSKAGPGLAGLANGVLRNIARHRADIRYPEPHGSVDFYAVFYSQPEWLVERLLNEYDRQQVEGMLAYFNCRPQVVLRSNTLKTDREQLIAILSRDGIIGRLSPRSPWGVLVDGMERSLAQSEAYQAGLFYVQNEASMLAAIILAPRPGATVLDLCCGVGGKTTFIAELMGSQGRVDAYDIHNHKINLLKSNCDRLGLSIVSGHQQDLMALALEPQSADRVLLDAPCSGLGVLNRRSDARWRRTPQDLTDLQSLQARMLEKAAPWVKSGGSLVYSTCTILKAENEDLIQAFLSRHPEFILDGFQDEISFFPLDPHDLYNASRGMLTILPGKYGTDGMFYARLRRIDSA